MVRYSWHHDPARWTDSKILGRSVKEGIEIEGFRGLRVAAQQCRRGTMKSQYRAPGGVDEMSEAVMPRGSGTRDRSILVET